MKDIRKLYLEWTFEMVLDKHKSFRKVSLILDTIPFYWNIPNDDQRIGDALGVRRLFILENNLSDMDDFVLQFLASTVSIFEVIVGIVRRMEDNLYRPTIEPRYKKYYAELLTNLGFEEMLDRDIHAKNKRRVEAKVKEAARTLIDRTYDRQGNGSLFPIRRVGGKNMATTEIWYQMMVYLDENYLSR